MVQDYLNDVQGYPLDFDFDNFITPYKDYNDDIDLESASNGNDVDTPLIENTPKAIASFLNDNHIKVDPRDPYSLASGMAKISNDWQAVYYDDSIVAFDTLESQHDMNRDDNIDDIAYLLSDTTEEM